MTGNEPNPLLTTLAALKIAIENLETLSLGGPLGRAADAASLSAALSTEDVAILTAIQDRLGALTTPAAGSANKLLTDLLAKFPDQSGSKVPVVETALAALIGALADAPASISADETISTLSSLIALLKASKNLDIDISGYLSTLAGAVTSSKVQVDIKTIAAGTTFIGQVGSQSFKVLQSFTRPADTTAYTALDCIGPVTTPAIMTQDLASYGATVGRFLVITNARIISSIKGSGLSVNIAIMPTTFVATADNAELSIDDTTAALGGMVIPCNNFYSFAVNSRCVSDPGYWKMQLAAASTTIFFALQAANAYTPTSGEVFTVVMEGHFE